MRRKWMFGLAVSPDPVDTPFQDCYLPDKAHNSLKWYINDAKRNLKKASDSKGSRGKS